MRLRAVFALVPAALLLASCSSSDTDQPETTTAAPTTQAEDTTGLNARGAVEVALGETATVTQNGTTVLTISDTSLSTDTCDTNTNAPEAITKQGFSATIEIGPTSIPEWLWPSDFYYVDAEGRITKNVDTSDAEPCSGPGGNAFKGLPANSGAEGRVTLDVPNTTEVIGYSTTQGGQDIRVEWVLPETVAPEGTVETTEQAPAAVESTPTVQQTQPAAATQTQPATAPPVGFTGAPNGDPQPLVGKTIDYCMDGDMYQPGTTQFTDGTTGWTQECATG